jgi:hypothetical protein
VPRLITVGVVAAALVALAGSPAVADDEEDEAIAEDAVLSIDDVPAGWEETPADDDTEETGLDECNAIDKVTKSATKQPRAESPNFIDPDDPTGITQVEGAVFVFSSTKGAKKYFKAWEADAAEACLIALGQQVVEQEAPGSEVAVQNLGLEGIGDDAVGRSIILDDPEDESDENTIYTDIFVARVGRAIVGVAAQDVGGSLPEGLDLLETVVGRIEEAL